MKFVEDARRDVAQIDACEGVLTSATLAIAETGTIVLQDAPGQGRRAVTLLPDYHLCLVHAADIVQTVPEAIARLQPTTHLATTFFSGPSATADIEMTRIKGVHGPRFVDVILIVG
jgi:L-lactate dehydrogenase complex protein LldG